MFSKPFCDYYDTNYILVSWLFLRGLALIYFAAFTSMAVQIEGLVGANGILPIALKLDLIERFYPQLYFWQMPTVFWFNASDTMLVSACYIGIVAASLLLLNIFPRAMLIICYGLYLSVVEAGQDFTHFQWDIFLLETGFLAISSVGDRGLLYFYSAGC